MKNLIKPENEAEARALKSLLKEHDIDAEIVSFHDTAYDGLFQAQYGWGVIRVAEKDFQKAEVLVKEWLDSAPLTVPWEKDEKDK